MTLNTLHSRFKIVKGLTSMQYRKEVIEHVDHLVSYYAKYHKLSGCYLLAVDSIPDSDLMEFSALVMSLDDDRAAEATGLDNPCYMRTMLPALLKHLNHPTDKDEQAEFISIWQKGICTYFMPLLEELIEERLDSYNTDRGYVNRVARHEAHIS